MRQALQPRGRMAIFRQPKAARPKNFPAPTRGLVTNQNLARAPDQAALVLDNWFPTQTGIRPRGGCELYATLGAACTAMFTYQAGTTEKLFAADANNIYDITTVADPEVAPSAAVGSLTGGDWSTVQMETSGGVFLLAANGEDDVREFNGSAWSTNASTGVTLSLLSQVFVFKRRVFFIEGGTNRFWYLSVGVKSGALTDFSLAGVFKRGGNLLFGASWSLDAGDGVDDLCVFVSTLGEVVIYQGDNPGDATAWSLSGRYDIAAPLGKNAFLSVGGDLLIATVEGIVPLSQVISKDPAALSLSAVTLAIEPTWNDFVRERSGSPWTLLRFNERNMMVVGMPAPDAGAEQVSLVANLETGGWCRFTGAPYDISAQAVLLGVHYTGTGAATVYKTETGGSDNGENYTCSYAGHFDHLGSMGPTKSVNLARATFRASKTFVPKVSGSVNYTQAFPAAPDSVADSSEDTWDAGLWDTAVFDSTGTFTVSTRWHAISKAGFVFAPQVQCTFGVTPRPDCELVSMDVMYETGAVVV